MNNNKKSTTLHNLQRNFIFIIIFLMIIFLEVFGFNHSFFVNTLFNLKEQEYTIDDGTLYGLKDKNGYLIAEHNDPNITYRQIDKFVKDINLKCINSDPDAISQIYYRKEDRDFTEENSIIFSLPTPETTVSLPRIIKVTSLRFDLTNIEGDTVSCQSITINPKMPFNLSYLRLVLLIMSIIGLIFGERILSPAISKKIWALFINNGIWIFVLFIILIDFAYPVTIAFDSAHYLWLAELIKQGEWALWDPIRYPGFPLKIFLSLSVFGYRQDALLIPMILAHVLLFIFCCQIAIEVFKPKNNNFRLLIFFVIFLFIGLDPTVVGYFHTLLTEYIVAMIATISCFVALRLFSTPLFTKRFYVLSSYFLLMVPISWHLKQPYIGAALFPIIIVSFLIILKKYSWKLLVYALATNILIFILVFSSTYAWNSFIASQGNPMKENRQLSTFAERSISRKVDEAKSDFLDMIKRQIERYFASTNFRRRISSGEMGEYNLTKGFQNRVIAHSMFLNPGQSNLLYQFPFYDPYTRHFKDFYSPPMWINNLFQSRVTLSNFLFITSYLLLPFYLVALFILWLRNKNLFNTALLILGGTAFLNVIAHLLLNPIDRYLFLGYPLVLLSIVILCIQGSSVVIKKYKTKNANSF
jgi:hypothetical protein